MVSAVSAICGKQPDVILGKPNHAFVDIVRKQHPEVDPWDIMMVGDRLETDIALAKQVPSPPLLHSIEWSEIA